MVEGERWGGNKNKGWEGHKKKVLLRIMMERKRKVWKEELGRESRNNGESHAAMEGRVIMEKGKDGGEGVKT